LGKPIIQHLLRCQGIGVNDYSLTLDALHLQHPRLLQRQGRVFQNIVTIKLGGHPHPAPPFSSVAGRFGKAGERERAGGAIACCQDNLK
jgi:hypothetical protein